MRRTIRAIGLSRALLVLAALFHPAWQSGSAETGQSTLSRSSAELNVSAKSASGPTSASSNVTCGTARPHVPQSPAGLLAAYGFEKVSGSQAPDLSGKGHPATLVKGIMTTGRFGNGIALNGTDAYVRIDEPGWPTRDYTYAIWVFPRSVRDWRAILEIQTPASRGVELASAPAGRIEVWSSGELRLRNGIRQPVLAWTHVALTRAGSLITLFLNGVAQRAGRDGTLLDFGNCPALIGVDADLGCTGKLNGFFSGVVDELQVYDCALPASEIPGIMDNPVDRMRN